MSPNGLLFNVFSSSTEPVSIYHVSDTFLGQPVTVGNSIALVLEFESNEEIQKIYDRLSLSGAINGAAVYFLGCKVR